MSPTDQYTKNMESSNTNSNYSLYMYNTTNHHPTLLTLNGTHLLKLNTHMVYKHGFCILFYIPHRITDLKLIVYLSDYIL